MRRTHICSPQFPHSMLEQSERLRLAVFIILNYLVSHELNTFFLLRRPSQMEHLKIFLSRLLYSNAIKRDDNNVIIWSKPRSCATVYSIYAFYIMVPSISDGIPEGTRAHEKRRNKEIEGGVGKKIELSSSNAHGSNLIHIFLSRHSKNLCLTQQFFKN